jgi:hypothetical protein
VPILEYRSDPGAFDPAVVNTAAMRWNARGGYWEAPQHGAGSGEQLARCTCWACHHELARRRSAGERARWREEHPGVPFPSPLRTSEVGPVREHLAGLLAAGMTRTEVAVAAGVDRSTINRLLRPDVRRVADATAAAVLAVESSAPQ